MHEAFERELEEYEQGEEFEQSEVPFDVQRLMARAWDLRELHEVGAVFSYPDALTPEEWLALRALQTAQRDVERRAHEKAKEDAELDKRAASLGNLLGRHGNNN